MTPPAAVYCLYPGYGPDHDPHPELRRPIRPRKPPRTVAPRPRPGRDDEPTLLDLLEGEPQCQQQP